jgi:hypothetical protein
MGWSCFCNCRGLRKVSLPATLETIGEAAFWRTGLIELRLSHCERLRVVGALALTACRSLEIFALPWHSFSISCGVFLDTSWARGFSIRRGDLPPLRKVDLIGSGDIDPRYVCEPIVAEVRCFDLDVQMGGWRRLLSADKSMLSEATVFGVKKTVPLRPPM